MTRRGLHPTRPADRHLLAAMYATLSALYSHPREIPRALGTLQELSPKLEGDRRLVGLKDHARKLTSHLKDGSSDLEGEHNRLYLEEAPLSCPPYEGEYGSPHIFAKTDTMADIAGFYEAFGLRLTGVEKERPDHMAVELEFMGYLIAKELHAESMGWSQKARICREAQEKFLKDHLARWVPTYLGALKASTASPFFLSLADLLHGFLETEAERLGIGGMKRMEFKPVEPPGEFACEPGSGSRLVKLDVKIQP